MWTPACMYTCMYVYTCVSVHVSFGWTAVFKEETDMLLKLRPMGIPGRRMLRVYKSYLILAASAMFAGYLIASLTHRPVHIIRLEDVKLRFDFATKAQSSTVHVDTRTADDLAAKVKVLCFVTTKQGNEHRATAVNQTWLRRCTRHLFVTSTPLTEHSDDNLVLSDVPEGRNHLTAKTFAALNHLYHMEVDNYDWFLKADDDAYVIMENLRLLLSQFPKDRPVYLGHHFRPKVLNGYMSGGASYVINRQALKALGEKGLPQNCGICRPQEPDEDVEVGKCLSAVGVLPYSTVDTYGRETFHPWTIDYTLFSRTTDDDSQYSLHPMMHGRECCSQLTITFHYLAPRSIYTLELMLYHVSVYGRHSDDVTLRKKLFHVKKELVPHNDTD